MQGPKAVATRRWFKRAAIEGGLSAIALVSRRGFVRRLRGAGAIFTLHHVRPTETKNFDPSAHLTIAPEFLDAAIVRLKALGHRPIPLLDLPAYVEDPSAKPPAMVFTLDDGYRDNLEYALPVFERHGVPFTVFVTGGFVDRTHSIWWKTCEALLARVDRFDFDFGHGVESLRTVTLKEKYAAFDRLHRTFGANEQKALIARLDALARIHGIEPLGIVDREVMNEAELRRILESPLASLGAHTISHCSMAHVCPEVLTDEIEQSARRVEDIAGLRPRAFAYPYGDHRAAGKREYAAVQSLGFELAVTTNADVLGRRAPQKLHALNRISLNGYYQKPQYVEALVSGLPFHLRDALLGPFDRRAAEATEKPAVA